MLSIDGAMGEGGGQILRTSLALSAITGTPVTIEHIRARRKNPGLQRQHLVAVQAAARVCNAALDGAELESSSITFSPQQPQAGTWHFDIGSAGSTTLVLQTVLPILLHAAGTSTISIRGGTHNSMAPPVEFLNRSFLPILHRIGISATIELERHGFYPAGGGAIRAIIHPWSARAPLLLRERGHFLGRHAEILVSNLPGHVARREGMAFKQGLQWSLREVDEREVEADGPGNALIAQLRYSEVTAVFTAFGELRKQAEAVAQEACTQIRGFLDGDVPVCPHLADQLLLPLALGAGGIFRTSTPSEHTLTNAAIISRFLGEVVQVAHEGGISVVTVSGRGASAARAAPA
jgi:RNA 3'-terminal phosphate cyclase (ATP)